MKNKEININNPNNRLDIVHVYDIIDAYMKLYDKIASFNKYESFNVARDINYSISEIHQAIDYNLGLTNDKINEDNIDVFSNPNKIKDILNWEPKIGIYDGIRNTIDYYKNKYNL